MHVILVTFLLVISLSSILTYYGPHCPSDQWKFLQNNPEKKCFQTAIVEENLNSLAYLGEVCLGTHREAHPSVLRNKNELEFVRSNLLFNTTVLLVGVYADLFNAIWAYDNQEYNTTLELPRHVAGTVMGTTKEELAFFNFQPGMSVVCELTMQPLNRVPYIPPSVYLDTECPLGWEKRSIGYASKCFKVHWPVLLRRCHLLSACSGAHPAALPAAVRSEEEKGHLIKNSEYHNAYTGMHIPCFHHARYNADGHLSYIYVNEDPVNVTYTADNARDDPKSPENDQIYESILMITKDGLEDRPEGVSESKILCEITLPQLVNDTRCSPDFVLLRPGFCVSKTLKHVSDTSKEKIYK